MVLSPEVDFPEEFEEEIQSSRTHKIDFESGRLTGGIIDGIEAIKQYIFLSFRTARYAYPIYSSDIGSEIQDLLSDTDVTINYKIAELPRLITEALIYDDRIIAVNNFEIIKEGNKLFTSFTVISIFGDIAIKEVFEIDVRK